MSHIHIGTVIQQFAHQPPVLLRSNAGVTQLVTSGATRLVRVIQSVLFTGITQITGETLLLTEFTGITSITGRDYYSGLPGRRDLSHCLSNIPPLHAAGDHWQISLSNINTVKYHHKNEQYQSTDIANIKIVTLSGIAYIGQTLPNKSLSNINIVNILAPFAVGQHCPIYLGFQAAGERWQKNLSNINTVNTLLVHSSP